MTLRFGYYPHETQIEVDPGEGGRVTVSCSCGWKSKSYAKVASDRRGIGKYPRRVAWGHMRERGVRVPFGKIMGSMGR